MTVRLAGIRTAFFGTKSEGRPAVVGDKDLFVKRLHGQDARHDHDHSRDQSQGHDHDSQHGHEHFQHSHEHDCGHDHDDPRDPSLESDRDGSPSAELTQVYNGQGIQFRYPRPWELQEETSDGQQTVTVQSPGTTYWSISLFEDLPDPDQIVASVLSAYRESYPDLDVYESDVQVLGLPAIARDLDFLCLDLVSSASVLVFQTPAHTVLVSFQGEDRELEKLRPVLESITRSLVCDVDDDTES